MQGLMRIMVGHATGGRATLTDPMAVILVTEEGRSTLQFCPCVEFEHGQAQPCTEQRTVYQQSKQGFSGPQRGQPRHRGVSSVHKVVRKRSSAPDLLEVPAPKKRSCSHLPQRSVRILFMNLFLPGHGKTMACGVAVHDNHGATGSNSAATGHAGDMEGLAVEQVAEPIVHDFHGDTALAVTGDRWTTNTRVFMDPSTLLLLKSGLCYP
ncbi:hypothetical protein FISHEDRAFT_59442 [Fistulina hepatica ATCC 64428]|uniref:Uncharacterized protein n=1 Tax=Fistulina hepatica ATCC 64428 TaxID=1128425 RepID=A0A0D7ACP7_9AGAR|nr:hypothetical protein FISHEDRAFT_59442 [Fistulina hepatica ATCC 64428]